ncbi:MAG: hypothetical protein KGJ59_02100 [Bacteroidota bacterium]|nr:hypothetical protein [Bacteroidota bacterium]
MKRIVVLALGLLGLTVSAVAFSGSTPQTKNSGCPLSGTPACPEYPTCCK